MTIKKNGVNMILDTRKVMNYRTMFYLKAKRYAPEGSSPLETNRNLLEGNKVQDSNYVKVDL